MLKKLPKEAYGLSLSLVEISDASDIVALRSDPELTRYMVTLEKNIEKQEEWIKEYKKREQRGEDLYFAYRQENVLVGLARLSHIDEKIRSGSSSSWIKKPNAQGVGSRMILSQFEVAFECLNLDEIHATVHKDNSKTLRHWQFFNCFIEEKSTGYNYVKINRNDFYKAKYSYFKKFLMS